MKPQDPRQLIPRYLLGGLNKTESDELARAALDDQALFNELMEAEPVRQDFADPVFRRQLAAELRARREAEGVPLLERLRRFFAQPWVLPVCSAAAVLLVVLGVRQGWLKRDSVVVQAVIPRVGGELLTQAGILAEPRPGEVQRLEEVRRQPVQQRANGALALDRPGERPVYRAGDRLRIGFRLAAEANVVVVEERADGSAFRLYPNRVQSRVLVGAGEVVYIPMAGQGDADLTVSGPPGLRVIKVLVFPTSVDPFDFSQPWSTVVQQATVLTQTYEVQP